MSKLRVTPIGTCRINTPLKRAQARFPIEVCLSRNYGYTHSSDEALQQLRFLQGDKTFRDEVRPIVFRHESGRDVTEERWEKTDFHIVEISSAKRVTSGADSVQINYLYRHFADFFSSSARTSRFWSLVKRNEAGELASFLQGEPAFGQMSQSDQELLLSLRMQQQDLAAIRSDMAEIVDRLGRETVLFVTHVNARTPDGSMIAARDRVIQWVKMAAEQLEVPCFDPSDAMHDFGQERAMEQGGLDLTHYTPSFSDRVYAEMHRLHVSQRMERHLELGGDAADLARQQLMADNIEALLRFDDFQSGARFLRAALRKEPDSVPLVQLRGKVLAQLGDFEGAIRDLGSKERMTDLTPDARVSLLEALAGTGDWNAANAIAEGLLGDEFENRTIYECAATACEALGKTARALSHWKQAFRHDRTNLEAARKGLELLAQAGQSDQLANWRAEVLEQGMFGAAEAAGLARWALSNRDEAMLARAFAGICRQDSVRAGEMVGEMAAAELYRAAASCLALLLGSSHSSSAGQRHQLAGKFSRMAAELFEQGQCKAAYLLADAVCQAKPNGLAARIRRTAESDFRKRIRESYRQGKYQAAVDAWDEADPILHDNSEAMFIVALALVRLDDNAAALELLSKAHGLFPDDVGVLRLLGRVAAREGRFEVALASYSALRRSKDPAAGKYSAEIERFFSSADRRAFRQLREASDGNAHELALDLADKIGATYPGHPRLDKERARLNRVLRIRLREAENGDAEDGDRERCVRLLLRMQPDDPPILRRAALDMMQKQRFREAADLWAKLDRLAPGSATYSRNLERCRILSARQEKSGITTKLTMA